ncbi:hypothetical protein [Paraferrimonas sp. SM1919]|uniref:hypothetical protein n=1 Tax=Paraferrimonas sp. SM1919 TaxID=2662263 RepID=UPI0013D1EC10|nr:hypothetical protein [Paraferrimonas sp. SM1919]
MKLYIQEEQLVNQFSSMMKFEIGANHYKGNMVEWSPDAFELISETSYHLALLHRALLAVEQGGSYAARHEVDEYSADVANLMAKICLTFGSLKLHPVGHDLSSNKQVSDS